MDVVGVDGLEEVIDLADGRQLLENQRAFLVGRR
jgi:hypothetical protein